MSDHQLNCNFCRAAPPSYGTIEPPPPSYRVSNILESQPVHLPNPDFNLEPVLPYPQRAATANTLAAQRGENYIDVLQLHPTNLNASYRSPYPGVAGVSRNANYIGATTRLRPRRRGCSLCCVDPYDSAGVFNRNFKVGVLVFLLLVGMAIALGCIYARAGGYMEKESG